MRTVLTAGRDALRSARRPRRRPIRGGLRGLTHALLLSSDRCNEGRSATLDNVPISRPPGVEQAPARARGGRLRRARPRVAGRSRSIPSDRQPGAVLARPLVGDLAGSTRGGTEAQGCGRARTRPGPPASARSSAPGRRLEQVVVVVQPGSRRDQVRLRRLDLEPADLRRLGGDDAGARRARQRLAAEAEAEYRARRLRARGAGSRPLVDPGRSVRAARGCARSRARRSRRGRRGRRAGGRARSDGPRRGASARRATRRGSPVARRRRAGGSALVSARASSSVEGIRRGSTGR